MRIRLDDWSEFSTAWRILCAAEYLVPHDAERIVDAGANIGTFTAAISKTHPRAKVIACEPFPASHEHLIDTIRSNHLESRVIPRQVALSGSCGFATFDGRPNTKSYCRKLINESGDDGIEVPTIPLPMLLDEQGWLEADYLKMDIEGGEYDALLTLDRQQMRRFAGVGLEYHDSTKAKALFAHFENCGFKCIRDVPSGWSGLAEFRRIPLDSGFKAS